MAFDARCTGDATRRPVIYLVQRFLNTAGNLAEYPDETRTSFEENFRRNIDLLKANPNLPLFTIRRPPTLDQLPDFLGAGDVVLGFVHLPPYPLLKEKRFITDQKSGGLVEKTLLAGIDVPPSGVNIEKEMDRLENPFFNRIEARLNQASDPQHPPSRIRRPRNITPGGDSAIGLGVKHQDTLQIRLREGRQRNVFYSVRAGIIDVGHPAGDSVDAWKQPEIRDKIVNILATPEKSGFGPQTVSLVKKKVDPQNKREIDGLTEYLKSVGRGLAYNLLHEFWHAAQGKDTDKHPFGTDDSLIEGQPRSTKQKLAFQKGAITAMLADYENTWCRYIKEGRIGVGDEALAR